MEKHKDWGISAGAPATAVQMVTWHLIRLIACATLVACHALPGMATLDFSLNAAACHISIGGKQQRCNTRCVGCVREANFFRKTPRHTCARRLRLGCSLSPAIPHTHLDNLPSPSLRNHTQQQCAGSRRSKDMFINNLILSILSDRCTSSRTTSQFSQSQTYLAATWQPARALK